MRVPESLVAHHSRFVSFVRSRVPDRGAAEDIVQGAYARSLESGSAPGESDRALRWFYRVLLNAVADHHRRQGAEARGLERFRHDPTAQAGAPRPRTVCRCVGRALREIKPTYSDILNAVEVEGRRLNAFAATAGISDGNAAVRLHRARRMLGNRLRLICGNCSLDGCGDCDCTGNSSQRS